MTKIPNNGVLKFVIIDFYPSLYSKYYDKTYKASGHYRVCSSGYVRGEKKEPHE